MTAWTIYTNENFFFDKKKKKKIGKYTAKLTFLWYDLLVKFKFLCRGMDGMTAISKMSLLFSAARSGVIPQFWGIQGAIWG